MNKTGYYCNKICPICARRKSSSTTLQVLQFWKKIATRATT